MDSGYDGKWPKAKESGFGAMVKKENDTKQNSRYFKSQLC